jgi:hypothetical protein
MAGDAALREAFRQLGCPEDVLKQAISACGTAETAKQWVEVIGPIALSSRYLYEIAMSKLEPDEYLRWHQAGLGPLEALQTPRHLAKAGLSIDDYLRWRSAGLGAGLGGFVTYLMSGLTFDELLQVLTEWNPGEDCDHVDGVAEFKEMLMNRLDFEEFRRQRATGFSGHQIYTWTKAGLPPSEWQTWHGLGFDADSAVAYANSGVAAAAAKPWANLGLSAKDALAFIAARIPITTAQQWISAGIAGSDALRFISRSVPLDEAHNWLGAGFSSEEAVAYIKKEVSVEEASAFKERGIKPWQVRRTRYGLTLRLHPWQKNPADQLRKAIKRGRVKFTLWIDALGGGRQAFDIALKWNGKHTVEWFEDISPASGGLSPASSSPTWGVASWPNDRDVVLTYTWIDLDLRGYARLDGAAPKRNSQGLVDPNEWIRFGQGLLDFVLLDLGSGSHDRDKLAAEYYCPAKNKVIELDDMFRVYLAAAGPGGASKEFDEWLRGKLSEGTYTTDIDYARLEAAAAAAAAKPRPDPKLPRRGGLGKNQRSILELLRVAPVDGVNTAAIAKSLGITTRASEAAAKRLEKHRLVVLTTYRSIVWLPERRLAWLQAQATSTHGASAEIAELAALLDDQRAEQERGPD